MLIYHPAFDLYNCVFRMFQLLSYTGEEEVEVERLRIWDFYLAFPREARKIRFPAELIVLKNVFKDKTPNPYEDLVDPKRIISRMKSYQLSALKCLASYGFIEQDALAMNIVKRTSKEVPEAMKISLEELPVEKINIIKLVTGFRDLPLYGPSGLKSRTGLIEYKYDRT